jgi:hypothetical protein
MAEGVQMSDEPNPESVPDPESLDEYVEQQSWWMDQPELAALDGEIEDATTPDWALDVIESYDFQAAYPSPVVPLWQLERPFTMGHLKQRVDNRVDRLERLKGLGAPTIIIERELNLVYEAYAQFYWKAARILRAKFKREEDGS